MATKAMVALKEIEEVKAFLGRTVFGLPNGAESASP